MRNRTGLFSEKAGAIGSIIRIIVLMLIILALLMSCKSRGHEAYVPPGRKIGSPVDINYVVLNPISINKADLSEDYKRQFSYIQISGLEDKTVENKINDDIKKLFEKLLQYSTGEQRPPYRGIEADIGSDIKVEHCNISIFETFNYNNVLSIEANASVMLSDSADFHIYFAVIETLNYDLTTGKPLTLRDLFTDESDGLSYLNDAILNYKGGGMRGNIEFVSPFKGIGYRQKFYLSTDGINIVFDYNNPEFELMFRPFVITVPYYTVDGIVAITERFKDGDKDTGTKRNNEKVFLQDRNVVVYRSRYYRGGVEREVDMRADAERRFPGEILDFAYLYWQEAKEHVNALLQDMQDNGETAAGSNNNESESNGTGSEIEIIEITSKLDIIQSGSYININSLIICMRMGCYQVLQKNYVYNTVWQPDNTLAVKEVEIVDLFEDGYDYVTMIEDCIEGLVTQNGIKPEVQNMTDFVESLAKSLMFSVNSDSIQFITRPVLRDINSSYHPIIFDIKYSDIGYENLKIFND